MKKINPFLAIAIALCFCACNKGTKNESLELNPNLFALDSILIIHTNDHHGAVLPYEGLGGLSQRAEFIETLKKQYQKVLILDAGDLNTGSISSVLFKIDPDILIYNLIGYDAVVLGNHEFDNPPEILKKQMDAAEFKFISANAKSLDGEYLAIPYIIKDFENFRIAVIGITTSSAKLGSTFGRQYDFENEIASARKYVSKVRETEKPDFVILLTHVGSVEAKESFTSLTLADSVAGIDLIIDGHSHTRMDSPLVVNGIPIVSAYEWGKNVGQAKLIFENRKVKNFSWKAAKIDTSLSKNSKADEIIKPFADSLQKVMGDSIAEGGERFVFIGEADERLTRIGETAIGNLACDAVMLFVKNSGNKADFALLNGGGIRSGLPKGKITRGDVYTIFPFENFLEIIELDGTQVLELFSFIAAIKQGSGSFAQVSKEVRYKLDLTAKTISDITINGESIDPARKYFIVTNDFLSDGGGGYDIFTKKHSVLKTQKLLSEVFIEHLQSLGSPIYPILDGRISISR